MGYTHYWRPVKASTDVWDILKEEITLLVSHKDIDPESVVIQDDLIVFNGHEAYEDFYYKNESGFGFCKTARKPYNFVVVAVLAVLAEHTISAITSDGYTDEWEFGAQYASKILGRNIPIPPGIEDRT